MALIECPECKKEISDKAESCPHCGFPISKALSHEREKHEGEDFAAGRITKTIGAITQEDFDAKKAELLRPPVSTHEETRPERESLIHGKASRDSDGSAHARRPSGEVEESSNINCRKLKEVDARKGGRVTPEKVIGLIFYGSLAFFAVGVVAFFAGWNQSIGVISGVICLLSMITWVLYSFVDALRNESEDEAKLRRQQYRQGEKRIDKEKHNNYKYTCPMCGSHRIKNIGTGKKLAGVATVGLASKSIGKNYQCDDCNYRW